ncbi:MAG: hypothetical protein AAF560_25795 [Acidobacteriota bacterium]
MNQAELLGQSLTLPCGAILPNRLCKSAMTEGLSDVAGQANARHERLYRLWSKGGTGLLVTGNIMVDWRYLERPGNVVVEDAAGIDGLRRWAEAGTAAGNHLWVQLNHAGRQASVMSTTRPVAPSAVQLKLAGLFRRPRALEASEIEEIVARFARAAGIVKRAGFTGVQVHSAHGYLSSQFLSPRVNQRTDRWGGSLENRARFLLEVVRAVRAEVGPDFPSASSSTRPTFSAAASSSKIRLGSPAGWRRRASTCSRSPAAPTSGCGFSRTSRWAKTIRLARPRRRVLARPIFSPPRRPFATRSKACR